MYFRQKEKVSPKVCNQLVAHLGGPGLCLFYDNSCQDVERPPAPSPVCNELVALFLGDSCFQSFLMYYITQCNLRLLHHQKRETLYIINTLL